MPADSSITLRLGTRGSLLAMAQSRQIAEQLQQRHPQLRVELVPVRTSGDVIQDRPLAEMGGKGLFVKELEQALLAAEVDFAVHSYKDVPVTMPVVDESGLVIAAVPVRADARDVAVFAEKRFRDWPAGTRVGTSSPRRRSQILAAHPQAVVLPLRGNIDTRLRKLKDGQFDLIVLAAAGLLRTGLFDSASMSDIDLLPAAGQGALALQCRRDDGRAREILAVLNDPPTAAAVDAERALVAGLRGDCHSPIAAWASGEGGLVFRAAVGAGGHPPLLRAEASAPHADSGAGWRPLVERVLNDLLAQGAMELLHGPQSRHS